MEGRARGQTGGPEGGWPPPPLVRTNPQGAGGPPGHFTGPTCQVPRMRGLAPGRYHMEETQGGSQGVGHPSPSLGRDGPAGPLRGTNTSKFLERGGGSSKLPHPPGSQYTEGLQRRERAGHPLEWDAPWTNSWLLGTSIQRGALTSRGGDPGFRGGRTISLGWA